MTDFRLVAIDLDGTLLRNDLQISPRAKRAIRQVRELGVEVTLCTGRMYASALPYAREIGLELPLVTYNGALVKNTGTGQVIYQRLLPEKYAREIIAKAKEYDLPVNVYHDDRLFVERITPEGRAYMEKSRIPVQEVGDLSRWLEQDPLKVLVMGEREKLDRLAEDWVREWGDAVYITKSWPTYLEFLHPEATKGLGLQALARHLHVEQEQVMGIGDSYNDLEMFKYAGFSVVMGNAEPAVKEAADYVTLTNDDDGVAEALEKFIIGA
ncbi:MAG: HAD family phosphatase [Clostridia bacterium]|jgi:Cof subfamily protein (haloacid dehalogenase superfamily)|nr:HAD family phosphatase [Clostridia bacterium]